MQESAISQNFLKLFATSASGFEPRSVDGAFRGCMGVFILRGEWWSLAILDKLQYCLKTFQN